MGVEIRVNNTYQRSNTTYDVIRVIDIILKSGEAIVKCIYVYGSHEEPFLVGVKDTENWQKF